MILYLYDISADGGKTWSTQWLTPNEAAEQQKEYPNWIIKPKDPRLHYMYI